MFPLMKTRVMSLRSCRKTASHSRRILTICFLLLTVLQPALSFSCFRVSHSGRAAFASAGHSSGFSLIRIRKYYFDAAGKPILSITSAPGAGGEERDQFFDGVRANINNESFAAGALWADWISTGAVIATNVGKSVRPQASYVILFRYPPPEKLEAPSNVNIQSNITYANHSITIDTNKLDCNYVAMTSANGRPMEGETLTLNSMSYPLTTGRVFLADFNKTPIAIEQLNIEIPTPPDPRLDGWMRMYYNELLEDLKNSSPKVQTFLK